MRIPKVVLNRLTAKAKDENYVFERLYRNLYNKAFYLEAYAKLYPNNGNNTSGINQFTMEDKHMERIERLIENIKTKTYRPNPAQKAHIPQKNGKSKTLSTAIFEDQLVVEVVRRLLEGIYEPLFSVHTHGFRPDLSRHTALEEVSNTFSGTRWFIVSDMNETFEKIDQHVLIDILRRRIRDEEFIKLIWKFLRAGYVEAWVYRETFSGKSQGGMLIPLLMNIYLNEFDTFLEQYMEHFNRGERRIHSFSYHRLPPLTNHHHISTTFPGADKKDRFIELHPPNKKLQIGSESLLKLNDGTLKYVRFLDRFILGIIGSKKEAEQIKQDVKHFLKNQLKLELNAEKILLTPCAKNVRFLGYDIRVVKSWRWVKIPNGTKQRQCSYRVKLFIPYEKNIQKLVQLNALKIEPNNRWKPTHRPYLVHKEDLEILRTYKAEIASCYKYYRLASNRHILHSFRQAMKYSMIKTYANKYKLTVRQTITKFNINGKFGVRYEAKAGQQIAYFAD